MAAISDAFNVSVDAGGLGFVVKLPVVTTPVFATENVFPSIVTLNGNSLFVAVTP